MTTRVKNAVLDLINTYRNITVPQINEVLKSLAIKSYIIVNKKLTGFGFKSSCTLCNAVGKDNDNEVNCRACIYRDHHFCFQGWNRDTYKGIEQANTPMDLKKAYRKRADHLEMLLTRYENTEK